MYRLKCLSLAILLAYGVPSQADEQINASENGFLDGAHWSLLNRSFYERRDYLDGARSSGGRNAYLAKSARSDHAEEWAYGVIGDLKSGYTPGGVGFGINLHGYFQQRVLGDDYTVGKIRMLPVDNNGYVQDNITRGGIEAKIRFELTELHIGEQRIKTPVFSSSEARLLPETMTGWFLQSRDIQSLTLQVGHFFRQADRNSRKTENPLIVTYLDAASRRGSSYDLAGSIWQVTPELSLSAYGGRLRDTWNTYYVAGTWRHPISEMDTLEITPQVYRSQDTGEALAGRVSTITPTLSASLKHGPHKFSLGWQKVIGDTPFATVSRGAIWLPNSSQLSDFNGPHEKSWQGRYELDATSLGLSGFSMGYAYIHGSGTDGREIATNGGFASSGYGFGGKHFEHDLWLRYIKLSGFAKGASLTMRFSEHKANAAQAEASARQIKAIIDYPL